MTHQVRFWKKAAPARLSIGANTYQVGRLTSAEFSGIQHRQMQYPMSVTTIEGRKYWQFQNQYYWDDEGLSAVQVHALLTPRQTGRQRQHGTTPATADLSVTPPNAAVLTAVSDDAKQYIWARDDGRCRKCGATADLQLDHIIPLAKGGSRNADNLQVLCCSCNRAKTSGLPAGR